MAESIFLSENATLEKASEDKEMQEFSSIVWAFEQRKDAAIKRVETFETGFKPSSRELKREYIEVREYLRECKYFEICKNVLFYYTLLDGRNIIQIVLPLQYRDFAFQGIHNDAGHQGRDKTLWLAKQRFFCNRIEREITKRVVHL